MDRCKVCKIAVAAVLIIIIGLLAWWFGWFALWTKAMTALAAGIIAGLKAVGITVAAGGLAKAIGHVLFGFAAYFSIKFLDFLACQICKLLGFCEACELQLAPP